MRRLSLAPLVLALSLVLTALEVRAQSGGEPAPPGQEENASTRLIDEGLLAVRDGDLARAEFLFTRAAVEAPTAPLRATATLLAQRVRALAGRAPAPRTGGGGGDDDLATATPGAARAMVLVTTTALGLAAWGWTVPIALGIDNEGSESRGFLGLYMLTAASSFAVPFFWTRAQPPTLGQANLAFYGGTRGVAYGLVFSLLLLGDSGDGAFDGRLRAGSILLASVGGLVGGSLWARQAPMSAGQARTTAVVGDLGLGAGLLAGVLFSGADEDFDQAEQRVTGATGLAGAALGVAGGRWFSLRRDNSWGDGEVMRAGGLYGVLLGATASMAGDYTDSPRAMAATLLTGGALGLVGGDLLVRQTSFTVTGAVLVDLALLSGGLGGAGIFHLIDGGDHDTGYFWSASAGAGLAAGLAYYSLRDSSLGGHRDLASGATFTVLPLLPASTGAAGPGLSGLSLAGRF
jgi:hypothetical protein